MYKETLDSYRTEKKGSILVPVCPGSDNWKMMLRSYSFTSPSNDLGNGNFFYPKFPKPNLLYHMSRLVYFNNMFQIFFLLIKKKYNTYSEGFSKFSKNVDKVA